MRKAIIKEVRDLTIQEREVLLESVMLRDDIMEYVRESESLHIEDMFDYVKPYLLDYSIGSYQYNYMKVSDMYGFIDGVNDMNNDINVFHSTNAMIDGIDILETLELAIEASKVYTSVSMYTDLYYAIQDLLESYVNNIVEYLINEFVRILEYYDTFEKVEMESDYIDDYLDLICDSECLIDNNKVTLI